MMAAVARPKRRICEIKDALANVRADAKAHAHKPDPKKKKPRLRWRELTMDVAQYLAEWMPGEHRCQEAWLEQNNITAEELLEERHIPFTTMCADKPNRFRAAVESSSRFYGEWKLKSWVQNLNNEHGVAPPVQRVYEEFLWKLAGRRHNGKAVEFQICRNTINRRQWVRRWRSRWECMLVKKGFREPMPSHVVRSKVPHHDPRKHQKYTPLAKEFFIPCYRNVSPVPGPYSGPFLRYAFHAYAQFCDDYLYWRPKIGSRKWTRNWGHLFSYVCGKFFQVMAVWS